MTVTFTDLGHRYSAAFPDETERNAWVFHFGAMLDTAKVYRQYFTDADAAHAWSQLHILTADLAGYLHDHGVPADSALVMPTYLTALGERTGPENERVWEARFRACLILAHPTLTRPERDLLYTARVSLPEVDALLAAGPLDPATLALMGALR